MRYAIWNNKGGVGKTFISFILATEYAQVHPDKKIFMVDMCPQANLSEIILGGNGIGGSKLEIILAEKERRLTIGGYFDERISSPQRITGNETSYLLHCNAYNEELPKNLYLICGDPSLEIQAQAISQISSQTLPPESWKNVHNWLLDLLQACVKKMGSSENVTVFIDCNPSFSAYTELSMLAAERLIIPCTSDGSSARAIDNIFALLYGKGNAERYEGVNFYSKAKKFNMALPVIHQVLLNRSTQYDKKASKAFGAMFEEIKRRLVQNKSQTPEAFAADFNYDDIPDSHSVTIVCSHKGMPLFKVKPGKYDIHNENPQVNEEPLSRYKNAIFRVMNKL